MPGRCELVDSRSGGASRVHAFSAFHAVLNLCHAFLCGLSRTHRGKTGKGYTLPFCRWSWTLPSSLRPPSTLSMLSAPSAALGPCSSTSGREARQCLLPRLLPAAPPAVVGMAAAMAAVATQRKKPGGSLAARAPAPLPATPHSRLAGYGLAGRGMHMPAG